MFRNIILYATLFYTAAAHTGRPQDTVIVFDINDVLVAPQSILIHDTLACAEKLHTKNYMQFLFSNAPDKYFNKIKNLHSGFTTYFSGKYLYSADNNFISKNHPEAFKKLIHEYVVPAFIAKHNKLPKTIIFIDDKEKNFVTAQKGLEQLYSEQPQLNSITLKTVHYKPHTNLINVLFSVNGELIL